MRLFGVSLVYLFFFNMQRNNIFLLFTISMLPGFQTNIITLKSFLTNDCLEFMTFGNNRFFDFYLKPKNSNLMILNRIIF